MIGLFVALGIAILTLIAILLWFLPHLLQQHSMRMAEESAQLREMLSEIISEHEAVAMRQVQLGTSLSYLQDQIEQVIPIDLADDSDERALLTVRDQETLTMLETRLGRLQDQIDHYIVTKQQRDQQENEAWANLLNLLNAMQERLRNLPQHTGIVLNDGSEGGRNGYQPYSPHY